MERGRPKKVSGNGRQRSLYLTDEELILVKKYISELRGNPDINPLRDIEKRLSALEAAVFDNDKLTLD